MSVVKSEQAEAPGRILFVRRHSPISCAATYVALAALIAIPGSTRARGTVRTIGTGSPSGFQAIQQDQEQTALDGQDQQQDQEQKKRDREQEARDREQEKRDREQERR